MAEGVYLGKRIKLQLLAAASSAFVPLINQGFNTFRTGEVQYTYVPTMSHLQH